MTSIPGARPNRSARRLAVGLTALALAATAACGGSGGDDEEEAGGAATLATDNPEPTGEPQEGGSITVALEGESNGWLPGTSAAAAPGYNVLYSIYDPLIMQTAEGTYEPYLAESIEPNEDFTSWTMKLREGVTFHDGSPLTAEVIAQNLAILKEPTSNVAGALAEVTGATAVDPLTVRYDLAAPNAAFPALLTTTPGMPFSMENYNALGKDGANAEPVGTGPFVFEEWRRDDQLTVTANESYWGSDLGLGPYLDEITFRPIPDEDSRLQSLLSGDVDAFQTLRQSVIRQAQEEAADGGMALHTFLGNNAGNSIFNTLVPPLDDPRVRQALTHAVDQEQLIEVLGGTGISPPQTQFFSEESPYYSEAVAEAYPDYDPEKAEQLLQEYIDDPQRSDGLPVGSPIAIEYNCQPDPSLVELSQAYQAFWSNVGVDVSLNAVDQASHIQNAIGSPATDPPFKGDFTANCWRSGSQNDPYIVLRNEFGPVAKQPLNFTNYTSDVIDEQLQVLATTQDLETRKEAVEKIGLDLAENVPQLWTGATATLIGTRPELQNVSGWELPSGAEGIGTGLFTGGTALWGQTWLADAE
ncbi:ABC transporter substrate-binding protein [Blastococcus saxobsidens]|uniref:Putative Extracellular solute-binding protein n=1 Tax=Blastococcus saxobsidens (strain DD2) TaxID=1146883 RepID=H6RKU2_BLASD|nr:ABC transporter substrate-binding protein [Blastococcus saxobsidens]CCG03708.1 putative Extracellular solute-binding protein [Blastococcus saxobsidens DD2]